MRDDIMCLAVPMRIVEISGSSGIAEFEGAKTRMDLTLIDSPQIGDYVIVHAGFAIDKLNLEEAESQIALFKEIAEIQRTAFDGLKD